MNMVCEKKEESFTLNTNGIHCLRFRWKQGFSSRPKEKKKKKRKKDTVQVRLMLLLAV